MSYAGLGIELVLPIVILGYMGYKLDGWLQHKHPWFLFGGAVLGILVGFYSLWRRLLPVTRGGGSED